MGRWRAALPVSSVLQYLSTLASVLGDGELLYQCPGLPLSPPPKDPHHCTKPQNTTLLRTARHCTARPCTVLYCTALNWTNLHCKIPRHCCSVAENLGAALQWNPTYHTTLHSTSLHYTLLPSTALHCTLLHCTASTVLHYTLLPSNY